jgi:hypothetical protein
MISGERASRGKRAFPWTKILNTSNGLTILELIIAFMVLQVALVLFAQFITKALDFSREVRRLEMAQILAQSKMEELIRTLSLDTQLPASLDDTGSGQILNERPGAFYAPAHIQAEDISPFRWIAEAEHAEATPGLLNVTLHVYSIRTRKKLEKASAPVEDFYISEDRNWFSFSHSLDDGTVEVVSGKKKLSVSSAIALP